MKTITINGIEHKDACDNCGKHQTMHRGGIDLCCYCHIEMGGIPADWHTVCVREYNRINPNKTMLKADRPK